MSINSSYTSETSSKAVTIHTQPGWVLGPFAIFVPALGLTVLITLLFQADSFTVPLFGLIAIACFLLWAFKFAPWNAGRKPCKLIVDETGITLSDGRKIDRGDIADIYIIAPQAAKMTMHTGSFGSGISTTGGVSRTVSDRSWRIVVEATGRKYVCAGGLSQTVARGILHEIGRVMQT